MTDEFRKYASPFAGPDATKEWAAMIGKCDITAKRWQDKGKIVVVYLGQDPYVDIEKTTARLRGENKRRGRAA